MIMVSIVDINDKLPQFLQYVKNGEKVRIVEEGKAIADIILPDNDSSKSSIEEKLNELIKEGRIIPAKSHKLLKMPVITERDKNLDWENIYDDTRSDR
jgi:antitoxin (DNA-binding transcriptional repressor) of toxin-antitoxin stability system